MPANLTPFDSFMRDFTVWMNGMWGMWVGVGVVVAMVVVIVVVAKAKARARDRVPHYRRQEPRASRTVR